MLSADLSSCRDTERNRQFELLVRKRAKIHIREVSELSGGITDARVFESRMQSMLTG